MAKAIWKYQVEVTDRQSVNMPAGAKILFVGVQYQAVCLWAEVDPDAPVRPRSVRIFGTGHLMPDEPGSYIGTFMLDGGALVFHAYDAS